MEDHRQRLTTKASISIVVTLAVATFAAGSSASASGSRVVIAFSHCCGTVPLAVKFTASGTVTQVGVGSTPVIHSIALRPSITPAAVRTLVQLAHTSGFFSLPAKLRLCKSAVAAGDLDSRVITVSGKTVTESGAACPSPPFDQLYAALLKAVTAPTSRRLTARLALPAPGLTLPGRLEALTASGTQAVVATTNDQDGCVIDVFGIASVMRARTVRATLPCAEKQDGPNATISGLWLGSSAVAAIVDDAPSPHGETFTLWHGPTPTGPLRRVGGGWSWFEDTPTQSGCTWNVVAGGGVVAEAQGPNALGVDNGFAAKPICVGRKTTVVQLSGATRTQVTLLGQWRLLGTDGKRLAVARLDGEGSLTGELALYSVDGKHLPSPRLDPVTVKATSGAWLTADGIVLQTLRGPVAATWSLGRVAAVTVAQGRAVYVQRGELRVRRVRDGVDRLILKLPTGSTNTLLASSSSGITIATSTDRTTLYNLRWGVIDQILPAG